MPLLPSPVLLGLTNRNVLKMVVVLINSINSYIKYINITAIIIPKWSNLYNLYNLPTNTLTICKIVSSSSFSVIPFEMINNRLNMIEVKMLTVVRLVWDIN